MALQPDDTLLHGKYNILRLLGRGGFVYRALETTLDEPVAVKELIPGLVGDGELLKRFLSEAKATRRLTHKHIVRTDDVFPERGNYYIVMEQMPGGSLEARLERAPLPVDQAVCIAAGSAKVADFGIAHVSRDKLRCARAACPSAT
jgi:serine/threonine-protein kinase